MPLEELTGGEDLTYQEYLVKILDTSEKATRNNRYRMCKVQWSPLPLNHFETIGLKTHRRPTVSSPLHCLLGPIEGSPASPTTHHTHFSPTSLLLAPSELSMEEIIATLAPLPPASPHRRADRRSPR
jgi:hypothetical protein